MRAVFLPSTPHGMVSAPPSKSVAHRCLIAGALSAESVIKNIGESEDVKATLDVLKMFNASIKQSDGKIEVGNAKPAGGVCNCRESGSTIRFMIPIALTCPETTTFFGTERLIGRGFTEYEKICKEQNLLFEKGTDYIKVKGPLKPGSFTVDGGISSQFITGLLFALPILDGDSNVLITGKRESVGYIDLTIDVLNKFGIIVNKTENGYFVPGNQKYKGCNVCVEGDWSNAAFLMAFGAEVTGLNQESLQADSVYQKFVKDIGKKTIDVSNCPDLAPVLFAMAALEGGGKFTGTHRLKIKESDRATAMSEELQAFGVTAKVGENDVVISGKARTPDRILSGHNDHRIVMALSVMCGKLGGSIDGIEAVKKSYPDFFDVIKKIDVRVKTDET